MKLIDPEELFQRCITLIAAVCTVGLAVYCTWRLLDAAGKL